MNCPYCRHENPSSLLFCGACGAKLAASAGMEDGAASVEVAFESVWEQSSPAGPVHCPSCGKEAQPSWKFCLGCGAELPPPGVVPAGPPVRYPPGFGPASLPVTVSVGGAPGSVRKTHGAPVALLVVLLLAVAGAGAFLFLRTSSDASSSQPPSGSAAAPSVPAMPAEEPLPPSPERGEPAAAFQGMSVQPAQPVPGDPRTVILDALRAQTAEPIRRCWEDSLREGAAASGRFDFRLVIGVDGKVDVSIDPSDPGLAGTPLEACVLAAMTGLDLAGKLKLTEPLTLIYPVLLRSQ